MLPDKPLMIRTYSYANSVLQALYFCAPFRELLLQTPDPALTTPLEPQLNPPPPPPSNPTPPVPKRRNTYQKPSQGGSDPDPPAPIPSTSVPGSLPIPSDPPTLFSALRSLFLHIATHPSERGTVAPRAFVDKVKATNENFRSTAQQDAHEFFNFALNTIGDEIRANRREAKAKTNGSVKAADCKFCSPVYHGCALIDCESE
jgi:ubiquitin carboxyl-terminal hydrolase 9/13